MHATWSSSSPSQSHPHCPPTPPATSSALPLILAPPSTTPACLCPFPPAADKTWMLGAIPVIVFLFLACCSLLCYRCCLVCGMGRRSRAALAAQAEGEAAGSGNEESDDRFQTWDSLMTAAEVAEQVGEGGRGEVLLVWHTCSLTALHCMYSSQMCTVYRFMRKQG